MPWQPAQQRICTRNHSSVVGKIREIGCFNPWMSPSVTSTCSIFSWLWPKHAVLSFDPFHLLSKLHVQSLRLPYLLTAVLKIETNNKSNDFPLLDYSLLSPHPQYKSEFSVHYHSSGLTVLFQVKCGVARSRRQRMEMTIAVMEHKMWNYVLWLSKWR